MTQQRLSQYVWPRGLSFLGSSARAVAAAAVIVAAPIEALANGICSHANIRAVLENGTRTTQIDKGLFYRNAREYFSIYDDPGRHYAGTDAILNYWNDHPELKDERWLAYILATAYHETARRMYPVREGLASSDEGAVSILANSRCCSDKTYWRRDPVTGEHYFGRGYVQLTWDYNYKRADERFEITDRDQSFYWNPERVLEEDPSIAITYDGMIYGWYTGRCLLQYIQPGRQEDYINARRIINGMDRAGDIAELAVLFHRAIKAAEVPAAFQTTREAQQSSGLGEDIEDLRTENAAFARDIAAMRDDLLLQIDELSASVERERDRFEGFTVANARLAEDMAASRTALAQSQDEILQSRQDLMDARQEIDATRQEIGDARAEIESARSEITSLRNEILAVRAEIRDIPANLELSATDKERLAILEGSLQAADADRQLSRDAVEALEAQIDALATQLDEQNAQFAIILRQLENNQSSNTGGSFWDSWFGGSE